jgi:hypothetical protein
VCGKPIKLLVLDNGDPLIILVGNEHLGRLVQGDPRHIHFLDVAADTSAFKEERVQHIPHSLSPTRKRSEPGDAEHGEGTRTTVPSRIEKVSNLTYPTQVRAENQGLLAALQVPHFRDPKVASENSFSALGVDSEDTIKEYAIRKQANNKGGLRG